MMRRAGASLTAALLLAGCAHSYDPIVDTKGVAQAGYQQDLAECRQYAEQVSPVEEAATGSVLGAAFGAALGAVVGAFSGSAGTGAAIGAATGGVTGGVTGTAGGIEGQKDVIDNCLRGRGYSILR